ncbi:uncharacterized protein [Mytilus edulis]|uniref:uncharacterized protein n=1 Tax=Mytilus edulis TaxID=6550 RepID=UPI0039EDE9BD
MAQVLKPNCSPGGKSLIPIILRVKNADAEAVLELSRLKKDEPLESLTKVELIAQFEKLTGESVKDVLIVLCGKDDNIENLRLLVHESILLANSVGARGQRLSTSNPSTDTSAAKGSDGKAAQGDPSTTNQQLQAMRQDLDELKKNSKVLQNGVPRVWLPAEQCLVCGYANDVGYQFCQSCGQNPVLIESSERITSNCSVERRLRYLDSLVGSTSYNKKKLSLEKEFEKFLFGGEPVKCLKTASPLDVRRFMVMKDSRGKTQVHDLTCEFLGKLGIHSCQCPLRLAAGTVQSMLGQLKAIFEANGRGSEWNEITKIGNPVCSPEVDKYLHAIQFEQSKSHVVQKQPKPLFLDKLRSISVHIDDLLLDPVLKSSERFIFLRDQAFFKVQYFSGDRANDLGLCISQEVKLLPNGDGFLFSHTVGKILGKGKVNEFSILRFDDTLICPVKALERYV